MSSLRFFEIGLGCLVSALLNFMFGYWINIVLVIIGGLFCTIAFLENLKKQQAITKS